MATNIEIKARVRDAAALLARIEHLNASPVETIPQEDTFFCTAKGRLKLRKLSPDHGQLIYYERKDASGPKRSDYQLSTTEDPEALKALLREALGVRGVVRKTRQLFLVGPTRIHLDEVEGLGTFMELEVVLAPDQPPAVGEKIAADLMARLGIRSEDLIGVAYIDLL